jgi:hypothetical protein
MRSSRAPPPTSSVALLQRSSSTFLVFLLLFLAIQTLAIISFVVHRPTCSTLFLLLRLGANNIEIPLTFQENSIGHFLLKFKSTAESSSTQHLFSSCCKSSTTITTLQRLSPQLFSSSISLPLYYRDLSETKLQHFRN